MKYNSDFQYDLKFGQEGETEIAKLLNDSKIEVKRDRQTQQTGNVYIEYESRGKPSGLAATKASKWAYILQDGCILIVDTELLKKALRYLIKNRLCVKDMAGGDNNTSLGVLVSVERLMEGIRSVK
tara:strand:+ start:248 stop:625 length:378 start_codon:yes stop_codon:yes gene_type:complete